MQLRFDWLPVLLPMFLLAIIFSGCAAQSTPPGAAMFGGGIEQKTGELLLPPVAPTIPISQDAARLTRPMKGYELYSWQIQRDWYFALVIGTNRIKTYDEISSPEVRIRGLAALQSKLAQLPAGEQLFWSAQRVPNTGLPPQETIDQIRAYCKAYDILLSIVE